MDERMKQGIDGTFGLEFGPESGPERDADSDSMNMVLKKQMVHPCSKYFIKL